MSGIGGMAWRNLRLTKKAKWLLANVEFRNDHSGKCTCLACVVERIKRARAA